MNRDLLLAAELAAQKFVEAVDALRVAQTAHPDTGFYDGGMHTATIRRKSMDLTRALAALRKG